MGCKQYAQGEGGGNHGHGAQGRGGGNRAGGDGATRLDCTGLNNVSLDVTVLQPSNAAERGLLHLEADPLPVQVRAYSYT